MSAREGRRLHSQYVKGQRGKIPCLQPSRTGAVGMAQASVTRVQVELCYVLLGNKLLKKACAVPR